MSSSEIHSISFTNDGQRLAVGLSNGFSLYQLTPLTQIFHYRNNKILSNVTVVPNSNIIIFTGVQGQSQITDKSVCVFDRDSKQLNLQIECRESVSRILALKDIFIIALPTEVCVYKIEPPSLLYKFRSAANKYSPCDSIPFPVPRIAMTSQNPGSVKLCPLGATDSAESSFPAHNHTLSFIRFSQNGEILATASEKGTLIRVFSATGPTCGNKIAEFRRGSFAADIQSLVFSDDGKMLACMSSNGTVHLFIIGQHQQQSHYSLPKAEFSQIAFTENGLLIATISGQLFRLAIQNSSLVLQYTESFTENV